MACPGWFANHMQIIQTVNQSHIHKYTKALTLNDPIHVYAQTTLKKCNTTQVRYSNEGASGTQPALICRIIKCCWMAVCV